MIPDSRHLSNGWTIPSEGYADQPYVVQTHDNAWLCVMTTGVRQEGDKGQHIIAMRSTNLGKAWTDLVSVEPADGPEASYAVLLITPSGRIYCFYNHNTDRVKEVKREDGGVYTRVDSLGHYVFKYSEDHGRTWSEKRYDVPVREFACDCENVYGGRLRFFWNVGRPLILKDAAYLVLHKVGAMGTGFFAQSEGVFLRSENILTETDPEKIAFVTLPEGDIGLRTPPKGGRVAEEQSLVALSDGSLFCVYRSIDGWPVSAYSRDGGRTWSVPAYLTYSPGGRRVKHPRAANFVWQCSNGRYLYWFHNHGGSIIQSMPEWGPYEGRNPAWLMAGREIDTPDGKVIEWSQPEILLYDDDPYIRISYPDLIEQEDRFFITETQKSIGRVHEIDPALLEGLFNQWENCGVATDGLVLNLSDKIPAEVPMPQLPRFSARDNSRIDSSGMDLRTGLSLDLWLQLGSLDEGEIILDNRNSEGQGFVLLTTKQGTLQIILSDGCTENRWECDHGLLYGGQWHHVVVLIDGGPKIITFIIDGVLCDGGDDREYGWGRFSPHLTEINGSEILRIGPALRTSGSSLRIYTRALRTSEAVGNYRAETGTKS